MTRVRGGTSNAPQRFRQGSRTRHGRCLVRVHVPRCRANRRSTPLNLTWLEESLPRFDYDQLAALNKTGLVPLAGGENDLGVHSFLAMLQKGSFAYVQPEVLALGPTMLRTVGTLAAAYDVQIAPYGGSGGVCWIGLMHLIASMPNAPMMELIHEPPHGPYSAFMDIFTDPPSMKDGYITVPDGPGLGLGITIRPELIES